MQDFYTSIEDAKIEIHKRWQDEELKERVRSYLGGEIPEPFLCAPRAVLCKNIISPDREFMRFIELSDAMQLPPLGFEGIDDKFVTKNEDKMCLAKMAFCDEKRNVHYRKIIDIQANDGNRFCDINTLWDENLVDFHHRLLKMYSTKNIELFDDLEWYRKTINGSTKAADYYRFYLAFFVCHGVLFENFTALGDESFFTTNIFKPAFDIVTEKIGVSPLIYPILSESELIDKYWWCYPEEIEKEIDNVMNVQKL